MDFLLTGYLAITVTLPAVIVGFIFDPKVDPHGFVTAWVIGILVTAVALPTLAYAASRLAPPDEG